MSQGIPKQTLTIPLGQGLETDVDPKLLPVGKVTQLENAQWTALGGQGTAVKRPGYVAMPNNYVTSGSPGALPVPWQFALHKGSAVALALAGPRPVSAYSPALGKWLTTPVTAADGIDGLSSKLRGQLLVTRKPAFRTNATVSGSSASAPYVATDGTYALVVHVYTDPTTAGFVLARIIEISTGKTLFSYNLGSGAMARAIYANGVLTAIWNSAGTTLTEVHWSTSAIAAGNGAVSSSTNIATDYGAIAFDIIANGSTLLLLYGANTAKTNILSYTAGTPGSRTTVELKQSGGSSILPGNAVWMRDLGGSGRFGAACSPSSGVIGLIAVWDINLGTGVPVRSEFLDSTAPLGPYVAISAHTFDNSSGGHYTIVYQVAKQPAPIRIAWRDGGGPNLGQPWLWSTSLLSTTFSHNGDFYALIAYESATQGSYFAIRVPTNPADSVDMTRAPVARFCTKLGTSQGLNAFIKDYVPVVSINGSTLLSVAAVKTRLIEQPGLNNTFDTGIDLLTLTFDPVAGTPREYADSTYVCGGLLGAFDGQTFAEEGFHVFPEAPVITPTAGGSMTLLGAYWFVTVFKYNDANGRVHRSAPSNPVLVTLTGANRSVSIVQKTLKLTGRPAQNAIEYYRVVNAGDLPVMMVLAGVVSNDETVDTVTINDGTADTSMQGAMPLYSTGGVLESGPAPSPIALAIYNGQLAAVLADDPMLIQIALPLTDFDGPGWPIFDNGKVSSVRIQDAHGDLVALAAMDEKLIAFKGDAVYALNGTGPDVTGNGTWGAPAIVCTGDGCAQPRSVVETSDGVIFRSTSGRNGYFLLNRGLTLQYIGGPVQVYLNDTIVDAVYVASLSRVMFFTAQGRTHVYDQASRLWTTWTNQAAAAAGLYNGLPIYQQAGQTAFSALREDASGSFWDENGTPNDEYALTPWLSLAGLNGYERFFKLQGLGKTVGAHLLTVTMWINYDDSTPFSSTTIQIGGPGPTADWNGWEFKHPTKASAVRFGIRCGRTPATFSDTAGANITGITIEWGGKVGLRKVSSGNRTK